MRDIEKGFRIESPDVFIPWHISVEELVEIFRDVDANLKYITIGCYSLKCKALDGIELNIGFHFEPREGGVLTELEFFLDNYSDLDNTYDIFQSHLKSIFGKSHNTQVGTYKESMPTHIWRKGSVRIDHCVFERFGPEEHVRIKKIGKKESILLYITNSRMLISMLVSIFFALILFQETITERHYQYLSYKFDINLTQSREDTKISRYEAKKIANGYLHMNSIDDLFSEHCKEDSIGPQPARDVWIISALNNKEKDPYNEAVLIDSSSGKVYGSVEYDRRKLYLPMFLIKLLKF